MDADIRRNTAGADGVAANLLLGLVKGDTTHQADHAVCRNGVAHAHPTSEQPANGGNVRNHAHFPIFLGQHRGFGHGAAIDGNCPRQHSVYVHVLLGSPPSECTERLHSRRCQMCRFAFSSEYSMISPSSPIE